MNDKISIADLAALITAAGITIYVLGLVGLAVSIRLRFRTDLPTAWYAVSLLPRTIVAGQGVRIWLGWPIVLTLVVLAATLVSEALWKPEHLYLGIVIVVAFVDIFIRAPASMRRYFRLRSVPHTASSITWVLRQLLKVVVGTWVMVLGAVIMTLAAFLITQQEAPAGSALFTSIAAAIGDNRAFGILLLFVGSFIVGVPVATLISPPLPLVKITPPEAARAGMLPPPIEGHLVAHSNGFWHLFDKNNELLSIPDDRVSSVRIASKTERGRLLRFLVPKDK
jgi:hypothetical protein